VDRVIVVVPPGKADEFTEPGIETVDGGEVRSESVANGLRHLASGGSGDLIVVHDAARPLVTPDLVDAAVEALQSAPDLDAVIAAAQVTDTIKRVGRDGTVEETLDRSVLISVQTPQVFRLGALERAIETGDLVAATDDASLIEAAGGSVGVIEAPSGNIKVTVPGDLDLAARLLEPDN
jgi:2-C-methyl-D-erythritol 4-phosphate cytidylyltransferase